MRHFRISKGLCALLAMLVCLMVGALLVPRAQASESQSTPTVAVQQASFTTLRGESSESRVVQPRTYAGTAQAKPAMILPPQIPWDKVHRILNSYNECEQVRRARYSHYLISMCIPNPIHGQTYLVAWNP